LPETRGPAHLDQLVAGRKDDHSGARDHPHPRHAGCGQQGDLARAEQRASAEHGRAGLDVLTGLAHVLSHDGPLEHVDLDDPAVRRLDRDDRVRAAWQRSSGHDPHRLAGGQRQG
jgi:hypothetical protein